MLTYLICPNEKKPSMNDGEGSTVDKPPPRSNEKNLES